MAGLQKNIKELEEIISDLTVKLDAANEFCRNSREKFQKALMASPDPVCILEIDTLKIVELNSNFEKIFGHTKADSIGKTSLELNLWSEEEDRQRIINELLSKGHISNFETRLLDRKGEICNTIISAEKIISDGKDCLLIYLRQVTSLRNTEDQYRLLAENSTDVIWVMEPDGQFTYVSPSVKKLRGYTPEEVIKQPLREVLTEESMQKISILLESLLSCDKKGEEITDSFQTEVEQLCKDGSAVWTEVLVTPIKNGEGRIKEILGVSRNIQGKRIAQQKAHERNRTLESIFRSSPTGLGMIADRIFVLVNDRFCDMLGYNRKEILGRNARFIYESDEEYERVGRVKYEKIKEGGSGGLNTRLVKKDGTTMDVYLSSSPIDINDWSKGVIFNILDLTSIREAEIISEVNQKKYSSLIDHINDAIFIHPYSENGFMNFVEVNNIACEAYGYSREEFLNLNAADITSAEEMEIHCKIETRKKLAETGSMVFETRHIRKNGTVFPVEISSNIVDVNNEKLILAVVRDISDRKEAERALVESESKHRQMFESSPEAMILVDKMGFISDCNSAFCKISGRHQDEFIGKHFARINMLVLNKIPQYLKLFNEVIIQRKNKIADFEWLDKNGDTRNGVVHMGPVFKKGRVIGVQGLLKDTTQQKEFEKNLIRAKEKAEENDRLKSAFLETMSHELRTPLNAVIGFSNLINDEKNIDTILEMNRYISDNGKKLLTIIESIFDLSILETKSSKIKSDKVKLREVFEELEYSIKGLIELEKKGKINTLYQPDTRNNDMIITTDRFRLKQLLSNLLTNAVRFTDKGTIRYGYSVVDNKVEFFVSDTGIGIPEDKQEIIFNKFQQIDNSLTRTRGGLGLGLAICKEITSLLGGTLRVESEVHKGSTFYFSVPVNQPDKKFSANGEISLEGKCFLVVEDVESNYLYLEKLLTDSGAEVMWAQTGKEAISIATRIDSIDLILMDIRMPDINGYEITRRIKKIKPEVPVIAQTAYAMRSDQEEAFEAGCSAHISKPIKIEDLFNTIGQFLEQPAERNFII